MGKSGASVAKIYLAGAVCSLAQTGEVDLDKKLKITPDEFESGNYGDGSLRWRYKFSGKIASRFKFPWLLPQIETGNLIRRMVKDSDNLATLVVVNNIGRERIQARLRTWGMLDTTVYNPQLATNNITTPSDTCLYLKRLSAMELCDQDKVHLLEGLLHKETRYTHPLRRATILYKDGRVSSLGNNGEELSYFHIAGYIKPAPRLPPAFGFAVFSRDRATIPKKDITYRQFASVQDKLTYFINSVS